MNPESNLYIACFSYRCNADCVYKTITILDMFMFTSIFLNALQSALGAKNWQGWLILAISLVFLYMVYKAVMLFCGLTTNRADGSLHTKTSEYLTIRKIFLYIELIFVVLFVLLFILAGVAVINAGSASSSDKTTAITAIIIFFGIFFLFYLFCFYVQWRLGASLEEASAVISGGSASSPAGLATNQVL